MMSVVKFKDGTEDVQVWEDPDMTPAATLTGAIADGETLKGEEHAGAWLYLS
ncbi:MAG TPA: hypothetical protein VGG75_14385 [Trebonia sp.]|jgi:hypothetical protein